MSADSHSSNHPKHPSPGNDRQVDGGESGAKKLTRRAALLGIGATAGAAAISTIPSSGMPAGRGVSTPGDADCATPSQTEGPFFPKRTRLDADADLTMVDGRSERAMGDVIILKGRVIDDSFAPVAGAVVDAWQANHHGRYDHEDDPNPAPLDPNFQSWAKLRTGDDGSFTLKTIIPGAYPVADGWQRPPHIHFKIAKRGYHELTTQSYFAGNELNAKDDILQALSPEEQERVVVDFSNTTEDGAPSGHLTIVLRKVRQS